MEVRGVDGAHDVTIRLLGPVELLVGDRYLNGVGSKSRAILAALASRAGTVVSVDALIDAVWGERPPASVRSSLQVHVARLRRLLAAHGARDIIVFRHPGYVLTVDRAAVDVWRWAELLSSARRAMVEGDLHGAASKVRTALALWSGDALGGLGDHGSAPLVRAQLHAERIAAVELAFTAELGLGHHEQIVSAIEEWATKEPYRETLCELLATSLYRSGRQAEALARITTLRRMLREDLGLVVSPPVAALELAILEHDPSLAAVDGRHRGVVTRTNLPTSLTEMVGREARLRQLMELLGRHRLVTLIGPGGVGKTRLAMEAARAQLECSGGDVWMIDLAPLRDGPAVRTTLADQWSIRPHVDVGGQQAIIEWIGGRPMTIVFDNCEHLLADVASLIAGLLAHCPRLRVIATSREALSVRGEQLHGVRPLDPATEGATLFVERARSLRSNFVTGPDELARIVELCRRLDGIPLAIELAAARTSAMSCRELLERIDDRFRLLRGPGRGHHDRHRTMLATVAWSHELLSPDERALFRRLAVFAGGFDLAAAARVGGSDMLDTPDEMVVLDVLHELVAKSLVVVSHTSDETRYHLLETLRQYGWDRLVESGEEWAIRQRHHAHFIDVAQTLDQTVRGVRQVEGIRRFEQEWGNLRAAHSWAIVTRKLVAADRLARAAHHVARIRFTSEHADWVERTLALDELLQEEGSDAPDRASTELFGIAGEWSLDLGDEHRMFALACEGLARASTLDDPQTEGCWWLLTFDSPFRGVEPSLAVAHEHLRRAVERTPDATLNWIPMMNLVDATLRRGCSSPGDDVRALRALSAKVQAPSLEMYSALFTGHARLLEQPPDFRTAAVDYGEALRLAVGTGDRHAQGIAERSLALAAVGTNDPDAVACCHRALRTLFGHRHWQKLWQTLESTVLALARAGDVERASIVLGHLEAHVVGVGMEWLVGFRSAAVALLQVEPQWEEWSRRGAAAQRDEVVELALDATRDLIR